MTDDVFKIENPGLFDAIKNAPQKVKPYIISAMQDAVFIIQAALGYAEYPESSEANRPGRFDEDGDPIGYYERGRGWWYPVKKASTLAGIDSVAEGAQSAGSAYRRHKMKTADIPFSENISIRPGQVKMKNNQPFSQGVEFIKERKDMVAGYKLAKNENGQPGTSELLGKSWTTNVTSGDDFIAGEVGTLVSYADFVQGYNVPQFHRDRGWEDMPARIERLEPQLQESFDVALEKYLEDFGE